MVRTRGSTPQRPGAVMLLRSDCSTVGTLGGGCVEAEVKRRAFQSLTTRRSAVLAFVLNHDDAWNDGLICGGRMDVAVMVVTRDTDLGLFQKAIKTSLRREPAATPITVQHEGKPLEYCLQLDVPPTLLIAGAGHVGRAVAQLAVGLDFHLVVIDDRADYASRQRFGPDVTLVVDDIAGALKAYPIDRACYIVIVTRGHKHDHQALDAVIRSPACYIGLIGSRRKTKMIFNDLIDTGVPRKLLEKVHTPIGLPIGAVTVTEIAVSIAAELIQVRRRDSPSLVELPDVVPPARETPASLPLQP